MSGHPAVEFLTAALARAEGTAKAATPGPWAADVGDETVRAEAGTVATMRDWARRMTQVQVEADMALIVGHADPVVVLRRVAAERQILAEHEVQRRAYPARDGTCYCCGRPLPAEAFDLIYCGTCHDEGDVGFEAYWHGYCGGPCRTVLLLAQAWGWEEEQRG